MAYTRSRVYETSDSGLRHCPSGFGDQGDIRDLGFGDCAMRCVVVMFHTTTLPF